MYEYTVSQIVPQFGSELLTQKLSFGSADQPPLFCIFHTRTLDTYQSTLVLGAGSWPGQNTQGDIRDETMKIRAGMAEPTSAAAQFLQLLRCTCTCTLHCYLPSSRDKISYT